MLNSGALHDEPFSILVKYSVSYRCSLIFIVVISSMRHAPPLGWSVAISSIPVQFFCKSQSQCQVQVMPDPKPIFVLQVYGILVLTLRPRCTNDDQAWTKLKFDPDLSSVSIFVAPTRFIAEHLLNSIQLWTVVWVRIKFWSEFTSVCACAQVWIIEKIVTIETRHSLNNKTNFYSSRATFLT